MHQRPAGPIRWERPGKPGGGDRRLARLDRRDQRTYRRLVLPLVPRIERSVGPLVFAPRATSDGRLRAWPGARTAWRRAVRRSIVGSTGSVVIVSDVRDCYPSMGERALEALGCSDELGTFLRALADGGVHGLPVGPDPSAILANGVLAHADRPVAAAGCHLIRWVDDVVLVAAGRRPAIRAFDAWRRALAELGLEAHDGKTRMFTDVDEALITICSLGKSGA
jgi:Reverse transcriptase (RNA-dependent DNA polymerase)